MSELMAKFVRYLRHYKSVPRLKASLKLTARQLQSSGSASFKQFYKLQNDLIYDHIS